MSNRRSGGFVNNNNRGNNRYFDNNHGGGGRVVQNNNRGNSMGNTNHAGQQGGWRQGGGNQNRQSVGPQGGGGGGGMNNMNAFDNRQFQQHQHQQQQMMNQNQFQNQLSNAVLRNSVGPNPGMMSSFGGNQDQPVVMVLPQSQATGGMMGGNMNNMGMVQSQNPFAAAVMNQQKPMQVIVGNLPAGLNPAAFGQQVLPQYGQGVGEQNMGMFGQQNQQGSNRFGRDNKNSSDRGRIQRNQKVTLVRRNDANDRGRITTPRGVAKKRGVPVREQYGDNKKPKTVTGPQQRNNRVALPVRKGLKLRRGKAVAGNKAAAKPDAKAKEAAKTATPNGNAQAATEGEAKTAEKTEDAAAAPEEKKPSKYEEVPVELLVCKICQKSSPDATAFETHLTSKVHVNLLKILEEKFTKRAELLMYESKMCEDEIAVEMDRPRRAGKGPHGGKGNKHHCKMCDCNYTVNWGTHKQSVWHRTLKEFLHPNCRFCKSQFVHRRDWVEHILSVAHMKKLNELRQEGQLLNCEVESCSQEELFAVHIEVAKNEKPLNIVNFHSLGGRQPLTDDIKDLLAGEKGDIVLPEGEIKIPEQYDENVAVGDDTVFLVGGSCCRVCRMYLHEGEQEGHCKSRPHFDCYVEYLKRVVKLREQKAEDERKAKEEAENKAKAEAEAAAKAAEEAAKAKEAAEKMETNAETAEKKDGVEPKSATSSPAKATKPEQMEVEQTPEKTAAPAGQKPDELVVLEEADGEEAEASAEKMEEDQSAAEVVSTPAKAVDAAKSTPATPVTPKTPQRGGQNNRGARGSPARGRGGPNRGAGGYRGGRGGQQQQQQTPARNAAPRVDTNMRGGRGGQARGGGGRGGARGSPGRGRGRGGW